MEIATIIKEHWTSEGGLTLRIRKGTLQRDLDIPAWNRWDVWGYAIKPSPRGEYMLVLRGDARPEKDAYPFITERGRQISGVKVSEYLRDWEVVTINGRTA